MTILNVLLVDDDTESLDLLTQSLPAAVGGSTILWNPCDNFDDALNLISARRFDVVVTDIYRDRVGQQKEPVSGDPRGGSILQEIRARRFCPVLLFTDGVFPPDYFEGPFVKLADKSAGDGPIVSKLEALIATGVPQLAHRLHDELDKNAGSYLWNFLEVNWDKLQAGGLSDPAVLDRLIRRRASVPMPLS